MTNTLQTMQDNLLGNQKESAVKTLRLSCKKYAKRKHLKQNQNQDLRSWICFVLQLYIGCLSRFAGFIGIYKRCVGHKIMQII